MIVGQMVKVYQQRSDAHKRSFGDKHDGERLRINALRHGASALPGTLNNSQKIDVKNGDAHKYDGPCRNRTYDQLIKSQLLYQLS